MLTYTVETNIYIMVSPRLSCIFRYHSNLRQQSYHSCSLPGVVSSSAFQDAASLSGTPDLFVGLLVDPIFIVFLITLDVKGSEICVSFFKISYSTSQILSSVSLSILTAISVDRLYALILGLRYRQTVTLKRFGLFLVYSWTQGIAFGLAVLINPLIAPYYSLV